MGNIEHVLVARGLTKEEAHWLEEELIKIYDTTNLDKGYNIAKGGKGPKGVNRSCDTRNKMSKAKSKDVICLTTKRIFSSAKEGAKYYGLKARSNVTECCQGKRNYAGKYNGRKLTWRHLVWNHNKTYRVSTRIQDKTLNTVRR